MLCCEKCPEVVHLSCVSLEKEPDAWFCERCRAQDASPSHTHLQSPPFPTAPASAGLFPAPSNIESLKLTSKQATGAAQETSRFSRHQSTAATAATAATADCDLNHSSMVGTAKETAYPVSSVSNKCTKRTKDTAYPLTLHTHLLRIPTYSAYPLTRPTPFTSDCDQNNSIDGSPKVEHVAHQTNPNPHPKVRDGASNKAVHTLPNTTTAGIKCDQETDFRGLSETMRPVFADKKAEKLHRAQAVADWYAQEASAKKEGVALSCNFSSIVGVASISNKARKMLPKGKMPLRNKYLFKLRWEYPFDSPSWDSWKDGKELPCITDAVVRHAIVKQREQDAKAQIKQDSMKKKCIKEVETKTEKKRGRPKQITREGRNRKKTHA